MSGKVQSNGKSAAERDGPTSIDIRVVLHRFWNCLLGEEN